VGTLKQWEKINEAVKKQAAKYEKLHGIKPEIFHFDVSDGEIQFCSKVVKSGCSRTAKKPYLTATIKVPDFIW
jgi:hypothetical protein